MTTKKTASRLQRESRKNKESRNSETSRVKNETLDKAKGKKMLITKSQHQRKSKFRLLPSNTWTQGKDQIKAVTATPFDKSGISGQGVMKVTLIRRLACKGVFSESTPVGKGSKQE